jgi:hypothetical protein
MLRNINNRTIYNNRYTEDNVKETSIDFCEFNENENKNEKIEYETLNEIDILVNKYIELSRELKNIRGRLYSLGIEPEIILKNKNMTL